MQNNLGDPEVPPPEALVVLQFLLLGDSVHLLIFRARLLTSGILSGTVIEQIKQVHMVREHVAGLAEQTGETAHLAVREEDCVVFLDCVLTSRAVGVSVGSGRVEPLHSTALGKALITDCDAAQLRRLFGPGWLRAFTPETSGCIRELADECQNVRQRGLPWTTWNSVTECVVSARPYAI